MKRCEWCDRLKDICPACEERAEAAAEDRYERTGRRWFR